jgi:preprotein translocase subunit SecE
MATAKKDEGQKWINASVAITCAVLYYVLVQFFNQIGEWFELEASVSNFTAINQVVSLLLSIGAFSLILVNKKSSSYISEAYSELMKVVFPNRPETMKSTFVIMILVTIAGFVLGFFDFAAGSLLRLLPNF